MVFLLAGICLLHNLGFSSAQYGGHGQYPSGNGYGDNSQGYGGGGGYGDGGGGGGYLGGGSIGGGSIGGGYAGGGSIQLPNLIYPPMPIGYQNEQGYGYGNLFLLSGLLGGYDKAQAFLGKLYSANMPADAGRPDDNGNGGDNSGGYGGNNGYGGENSGGYGNNNDNSYGSGYYGGGAGRTANDAAPVGTGSIPKGYMGPATNFGFRQAPEVPAPPDPFRRKR